MKIKIALLLSVFSIFCNAQTPTQIVTGAVHSATPNLLQSKGCTGVWSNTSCPASAGGTTGGFQPGYNPNTDTIIMGYTSATVSQTIAINKALEGSGVQVSGYDYSWKINNNDSNTGTLVGNVSLKSASGQILESYLYDYSKIKTTGLSENFQLFSGTQWFTKKYQSETLSTISLSWTGKDDKYWAGYWGPRVREPSLKLRYTADICSSNPLSSPDCPGYAEAYKTQQCTANVLYDSSCPGYAEAYKTQQCSINPLYDSSCSGYTEAYLKLQCSKDALYDKTCEGYQSAYAEKYLNTVEKTTTETKIDSEIQKLSISTTGNSTIDSVLTIPQTLSVTSPISVISTFNQNINPATTNNTPSTVVVSVPNVEKQQETKKTETTIATIEKKSNGNKENVKQEITTKAKELANDMTKAATIEEQKELQGTLLGLMSYVPGFGAYQNVILQDKNVLVMNRQYNKPVVDNRSAQRQLSGANEIRWREIVDSQYRN